MYFRSHEAFSCIMLGSLAFVANYPQLFHCLIYGNKITNYYKKQQSILGVVDMLKSSDLSDCIAEFIRV
jgi:hypothetical protein